eukprot:18426_1
MLSPLMPLSNQLHSPTHKPIQWNELNIANGNCQSECKELIKLGLPIGFSIATRILQLFTDQSMVGHLGTDYLAASSMASILMTISSTYIYAFCGTINVLSSQSLGAKNLHLVSEWMQLGCLLAALLTIPTFLTYYYCEQILLACGASTHIASLSGQFAKWSMLSILPQSQFMATRMYFKAQSNVLPATYICAMMVLFNLMFNAALVYGYGISWFMYQIHGTHWNGLGFIGSPLATACTRTMQYCCYIFYMFVWKKYHITSGTWSPFKRSTFSCQRIKKFLKVGIPQTISSALEDWQIQIIALFSSQLDEASLAAFSSSITIILVLHCASIGLSDAVSVRIANYLGANNPRYAQYIAWIGILIGFGVGAVLGGLLATVGKYLSYVVSGTHEIYAIYEEVFPIVGASLFLLSVFTVVVGILIAQARTVGLAISALVGCWGISVPMSYILGLYLNYGIVGIWFGVVIGYSVFALSTFFIFFKSDWKECAQKAVNRNTPDNELDTANEGNLPIEDESQLYNPLMSDDHTLSSANIQH